MCSSHIERRHVLRSVLEGVEVPAGAQPLDRGHLAVADLRRESDAGELGDPVDEHGAGAALTKLTSVLGSGLVP